MTRLVTTVAALSIGVLVGIPLGGRLMPAGSGVDAADAGADSASAVPGAIGAQDVSGPYDVVAGWPKDLSTLP